MLERYDASPKTIRQVRSVMFDVRHVSTWWPIDSRHGKRFEKHILIAPSSDRTLVKLGRGRMAEAFKKIWKNRLSAEVFFWVRGRMAEAFFGGYGFRGFNYRKKATSQKRKATARDNDKTPFIHD